MPSPNKNVAAASATGNAAAAASAGSVFADRAAARRALDLALLLIQPLMREQSVVGSGFLHIVMLDPALGPHQCSFEEAVLLEHSIGDRTRWDADYAGFAQAKARLAWLQQCDTQIVQTRFAHRLRAGDTLLAGGVCLDGIVVGVSGAFPQWDEAFATCVAACLRAVARERWVEAIAHKRLFASA